MRSPADRELRGTRLIIADDHKGLKAAAAKVLDATIQRCRVHFRRNAHACVVKKDKPIVTAALRTAFDQNTLTALKEHWAKLINAFEPRHAELMRRAEDNLLAYRSFHRKHWDKIHSSNPLERLRASLKIALIFALGYILTVNRHWGCNDGADWFFRSFGPLRKLGRQEGPAG